MTINEGPASPQPTGPPEQAAKFMQVWADVLAQVLADIVGTPLPCLLLAEASADLATADATAGTAPAPDQALWIVATCAGALRGEMSLRVPADSVARLAKIFMGEPLPTLAAEPGAEVPSSADSQAVSPATPEAAPEAVPEATPAAIPEATPAAIPQSTEEHREAVLELLRQTSGLIATSLRSSAGGDVQLRLEAAASAPSWAASATSWLRIDAADSPIVIELQLSAALVAALRVEKTAPSAPPPDTASASTAPAASSSSASTSTSTSISTSPPSAPVPPRPSAGRNENVNLDLLLDVELAVTLRFGSRVLLLRDVLDLNPGSVVDLDRHVEEPVDMLLDGRVVARGEVVVVGGNYGLRVTEVGPASV